MICSKCSAHTLVLEYDVTRKAHRVCDECYVLITEEKQVLSNKRYISRVCWFWVVIWLCGYTLLAVQLLQVMFLQCGYLVQYPYRAILMKHCDTKLNETITYHLRTPHSPLTFLLLDLERTFFCLQRSDSGSAACVAATSCARWTADAHGRNSGSRSMKAAWSTASRPNMWVERSNLQGRAFV